jgi:hypothetical protein
MNNEQISIKCLDIASAFSGVLPASMNATGNPAVRCSYSTTELALRVPVLLLMVVGFLQFGSTMVNAASLQNAINKGATAAASAPHLTQTRGAYLP